MPELLVPGVYVEETAFRTRAIEAVATAVPGIVGLAKFGPVAIARAVTSHAEFERSYGARQPLRLADGRVVPDRLAQAVQAFFLNGGTRLHVVRMHPSASLAAGAGESGVAAATLFPTRAARRARWRALWPGSLGNARLELRFVRGADLSYVDPQRGVQAVDARERMLVELTRPGVPPLPDGAPLRREALATIRVLEDGTQSFRRGTRRLRPVAGTGIRELRCALAIVWPDGRRSELAPLPLDEPAGETLASRFAPDAGDLAAETGLALELPPTGSRYRPSGLDLALELQAQAPLTLAGGHDGVLPGAADVQAALACFEETAEIDLLLAPDGTSCTDAGGALAVARVLRDAAAAPRLRPRFAILDPPLGLDPSALFEFVAELRSAHAALYWPWPVLLPADPSAPPESVPPSGAVAGIYARVDRERGVYRPPANEVLRGVAGFERAVGADEQLQLNSAGVCVLRFFPGKGHLVWGARTLAAAEDADWRYVPVRRFADFLLGSLQAGLRWVAVEPNEERTWTAVQQHVEEFLLRAWRAGALQGIKPEQAFYVRCDRTTMTQGDIEAGRLVLETGYAPVRPAEFLVLRIGLATVEAGGGP